MNRAWYEECMSPWSSELGVREVTQGAWLHPMYAGIAPTLPATWDVNHSIHSDVLDPG